MKRTDFLDALEDIRETYIYLQTKVEVCKEALDHDSESVSPFEKEKILDLLQSIKDKHTEIYTHASKMSESLAKIKNFA